MRVRGVLFITIPALVLAVLLVLSRSPTIVVRTNGASTQEDQLATVKNDTHYCQSEETLPPGTSTIRVQLSTGVTPQVHVAVLIHGKHFFDGVSESGRRGLPVAFAVPPQPRQIADTTVCIWVTSQLESISLVGASHQIRGLPETTAAGRALAGHMAIEYLRASPHSWLSLALPVARRMGLGRSFGGTWIACLAAILLLAVIASTIVLIWDMR